MSKIPTYYLKASMGMKRILWRIMHRIIINRYEGSEVVFLNYGYEYLNIKENPLKLEENDVKERYCLQLYHSTVEGVDLKNKDVLEIGCGRGGGASYISRYFKPKSYIGLDMAKEVIKFNSKYHKVPSLSFVVGNAQDIKFDDHSFDAIVNVESSRSYNDFEAFVSESYRVLRPKGHLLFADIRTKEENEILREQFRKAGFKIIKEDFQVLKAQNVIKNLQMKIKFTCNIYYKRNSVKRRLLLAFVKERINRKKGLLTILAFSMSFMDFAVLVLRKDCNFPFS
ncbi:MAG: class I SAM-dependent methyltransferase [Candidatus Heimdallarchaeaceae archaeon]